MIFVGFISALAGSGKDQRYQLAERLRSLSPQPVAHRSAHSAWLSVPTVAQRDQEDCTENGAPVPARRWAATHPVEGAQARRASCDFSARPDRHRGDAVESSLSLPCCRNSARQWEPRGRLALQRTWEKAVSAPARQGGVGSSATLRSPRCVPQGSGSSAGRDSEQQVRPQSPAGARGHGRQGIKTSKAQKILHLRIAWTSPTRPARGLLATRVAQTGTSGVLEPAAYAWEGSTPYLQHRPLFSQAGHRGHFYHARPGALPPVLLSGAGDF